MSRPVPTIEHAKGMLTAMITTHRCTTACTGTVVLGDGKVITMTCPYGRLDLSVEADRLIVQTMYASEARAAMGTVA